MSENGVVVFDDISWSPGMKKAWEEIKYHDHVVATFDLRTIGIAIIGKNSEKRVSFKIPMI
jgi:hypothetical protein